MKCILILLVVAFGHLSDAESFSNMATTTVGFRTLGRYDYPSFTKIYYVSENYQSEWTGSFSFCKSNGMELMTMDSEDEADYIMERLELNSDYIDYVYVGGVTSKLRDPNNWYWINSNYKKSEVSLPWGTGQPDNAAGGEYCLAIYRAANRRFEFHDHPCNSYKKRFICQLIKESTRNKA